MITSTHNVVLSRIFDNYCRQSTVTVTRTAISISKLTMSFLRRMGHGHGLMGELIQKIVDN